VLPGKSSEQNRYLAAFFGGKGAFDWAVEVGRPVQASDLAQAHALGFQTLLNIEVIFDLDVLCCHTRLLPRG
jgi:hypothetical protein